MTRFAHAHATHPDAGTAFRLAAAQVEAQALPEPTLGWLYLTDHLAGDVDAVLELARARWPAVSWVGAVGVGICANGVEYFDEPAVAVMLADLPREQFRVFSGARPLPREGFDAHTALVHADPTTPELAELIGELAARTSSGYLFGGLASSRARMFTIADAVLAGGLSGVGFGPGVSLVSRVTQGCQPVGPAHRIDASEGHLVLGLDGKPALDALLADLGLDGLDPRAAVSRLRATLVGLSDADAERPGRGGMFGSDVRVRHLVGLDPGRRGVAIADVAEPGARLAFCARNVEAARRDLTRICAEIRDELAPAEAPVTEPADTPSPPGKPSIAGAIYVSCAGRGGPHFGAPSAELAIVRRGLGDVPLVGFFAAGEIGHRHLYGYTGVLTAFRET